MTIKTVIMMKTKPLCRRGSISSKLAMNINCFYSTQKRVDKFVLEGRGIQEFDSNKSIAEAA